MTAGERIRQLREARHLSQMELGFEINVSQTTIYHYEHGRYIKLERLGEICKVFGITVIEFLKGVDL